MVAFDIDGIFIPNWNESTDLDFYLKTKYMWKPLFEPKFPYYMITSRPIEDKDKTIKWVNENFINSPSILFCENYYGLGEDNAVKYKADVISKHKEIDIFVESEINQVVKLKKILDDVCILHYETMIGVMLENLSSV